jgi:hypothetical protein
MAKKELQRSRENQSVPDETVATYTAAQGFLITEWIGAILMVFSFILLYAWGLRNGANVKAAEIVSAILMVLGTMMYWRSRSIYLNLDFPWRRGWEIGATLIAATAGVFWLFFITFLIFTAAGIDLLS